MSVLVLFPVALTLKYLIKSKFMEKGFSLAHGSRWQAILVRKLKLLVLEEINHITSLLKYQPVKWYNPIKLGLPISTTAMKKNFS